MKVRILLPKKIVARAFPRYWAYHRNGENIRPTLAYIRRGLTAKKRKLPDFIIIGAHRSGTTSLYEYLIQHEHILPALRKEVNFWSNYYRFGLTWYRGNFPLESECRGKITGEASVSYMRYAALASDIRRDVPGVKIIAILRNPVDRTFAHYNGMANHLKTENRSLEQALREEDRVHSPPPHLQYKKQSIYADLLAPYFEEFERKNILILDFNELSASPEKTLKRTCNFLGISQRGKYDLAPRNHLAYPQKLPNHIRAELERFFRPHNERLFDLVGQRFDWQ